MVNWIKACIVIALTAEAAFAVVRRVPSEYATIQEALDACDDGDTVLVAPGEYSGSDNSPVRVGKSIILRSEQGPATCIIDGQANTASFSISWNTFKPIIDGFTITNAKGPGPGIGVGAIVDRAEIRNCIITGNTSVSQRGGGIWLSEGDSNVTITNCLITGNQCLGGGSLGGGVYCGGLGNQVILQNCVIAGNQAAYGGGVACGPGATVRLENCVVTNNRAWTGQGDQIFLDDGGPCTINGCSFGIIELVHSCFDQEIPVIYFGTGWGWPGSSGWAVDFNGLGNIATDPEFAVPGYWDSNGTPNDPNDDVWIDGDYHLKSQAGRWNPISQTWVQDDVTSPCIDAGHPNIPVGNEPFPNGGIINIGAYGGTAEASKSYFGTEPCDTIMAGDINGDCNVDFTDIELLLSHWLWSGEPYEPEPIPREVYNPPNDNEPNEPGDPRR